jgi:hypothetical protein
MRTGSGCGSGSQGSRSHFAPRAPGAAGAQAAVGHGFGGLRQLQHRHLPQALADAGVDQVALVPVLLPALLLVFGRRQDAAGLADEVDSGRLAESVAAHVLVETIDAHVEGQLVVVGVDRLRDRFLQVHPAVAVRVRVAEAASAAR